MKVDVLIVQQTETRESSQLYYPIAIVHNLQRCSHLVHLD